MVYKQINVYCKWCLVIIWSLIRPSWRLVWAGNWWTRKTTSTALLLCLRIQLGFTYAVSLRPKTSIRILSQDLTENHFSVKWALCIKIVIIANGSLYHRHKIYFSFISECGKINKIHQAIILCTVRDNHYDQEKISWSLALTAYVTMLQAWWYFPLCLW